MARRLGVHPTDRRTFIKQAATIGSAALGATTATGAVTGQTSSPAASPVATPAASPVPLSTPVAEEGATLFDTEQYRAVMTFNIKNGSDEEEWALRRDFLVSTISDFRPIFLGTQEGYREQLEYIRSNLPSYEYVGVGRLADGSDEYNAIFVDTSRAQIGDSGTFWLSETPSEPGSMMPGEGHPRIATWAVCRVNGRDDDILVVNTHLTFEDNAVREQAAVLLSEIGKIAPDSIDIIMTGDFNRPRHTDVWMQFQEAGFADAWQFASVEAGPVDTSSGWDGVESPDGFPREIPENRIDWILYRPADVSTFPQDTVVQTVDANIDGAYPSDHFPVVLANRGAPEVRTDNLRISTEGAEPHQPVTVTATLTNNGFPGLHQAVLYVDREAVQSRWMTLPDNSPREVSFTNRLYEPGSHSLSIDLLTAVEVEIAPAPATLRTLSATVAPYVFPGIPFAVSAEIGNEGSFKGESSVAFYVDDVLVDSVDVSLEPGQMTTAGFSYTFDAPGQRSVTIGSEAFDVSAIQELDATWHFSRGDDVAWADPEFDDSAWKEADLPQGWEQHDDYTEDFVYGWYRQSVVVPAEWEGQPVRFVLGQIDDADKAYLNGELIGETGTFPEDPEGFEGSWNTPREYDVAPELINYGEENVLAIRVYDDLGGGGVHRGPLGMLPLEDSAEE